MATSTSLTPAGDALGELEPLLSNGAPSNALTTTPHAPPAANTSSEDEGEGERTFSAKAI